MKINLYDFASNINHRERAARELEVLAKEIRNFESNFKEGLDVGETMRFLDKVSESLKAGQWQLENPTKVIPTFQQGRK